MTLKLVADNSNGMRDLFQQIDLILSDLESYNNLQFTCIGDLKNQLSHEVCLVMALNTAISDRMELARQLVADFETKMRTDEVES